jgi:shikimate kinase
VSIPSPGPHEPSLVLLRGAPGCGKTEVARLFSEHNGWEFVEVDSVKRERHGTAQVSDAEDFLESGRRARRALDTGRSVIAEEFFNQERFVTLFMGPTGLAVASPEVVAVGLDCDVEVAVARKTDLPPELVRNAHRAWKTRHVIPGEIALVTSKETVEQVVYRMSAALRACGLRL